MKGDAGYALGTAIPAFFVGYVINFFAGLSGWPALGVALGLALIAFVVVYAVRVDSAALDAKVDELERITALSERLTEDGRGPGLRLSKVFNAFVERLQTADERERQFLASASHELRRPLAALRGELELAVRHRRSASELRDAIELALNDAEAMSRLTDDLLFHARDQAGMLTPDEDLVDLTDLVYGAVDRSQRALPGMPTLHVGDLPALEVRGDEDGLARVLENLIVNAGKHAGQDAFVSIDASVEATALVLHITDDGPGVPEGEQAEIFDAFARGDRARAVGGSGLGLSIARSWARAHGGDIRVTSPVHEGPRSGARFSIRLPSERIVDSAGPELA